MSSRKLVLFILVMITFSAAGYIGSVPRYTVTRMPVSVQWAANKTDFALVVDESLLRTSGKAYQYVFRPNTLNKQQVSRLTIVRTVGGDLMTIGVDEDGLCNLVPDSDGIHLVCSQITADKKVEIRNYEVRNSSVTLVNKPVSQLPFSEVARTAGWRLFSAPLPPAATDFSAAINPEVHMKATRTGATVVVTLNRMNSSRWERAFSILDSKVERSAYLDWGS